MIEQLVLGFFIGILIDAVWWRLDYEKAEKGFEVFEHYHFGLIIGVFGVLFSQPILLGIAMSLVLKESSQKHPFAIRSSHFLASTIIGVAMALSYIIVVVMNMLIMEAKI